MMMPQVPSERERKKDRGVKNTLHRNYHQLDTIKYKCFGRSQHFMKIMRLFIATMNLIKINCQILAWNYLSTPFLHKMSIKDNVR